VFGFLFYVFSVHEFLDFLAVHDAVEGGSVYSYVLCYLGEGFALVESFEDFLGSGSVFELHSC